MKKSTSWKIFAFPIRILAPVMYRARLTKILSEETGRPRIEILKEMESKCK